MFKIFVLILVFVLSGCVKDAETLETVGESIVSEEKESWGMRRRAPERPEFTEKQKTTMDKYGCIYLGAEEQKYLYLTFDEGYENGQTAKILDTLKDKGVTATFFITGDYFKTEEELVDRMVNEGKPYNESSMPAGN